MCESPVIVGIKDIADYLKRSHEVVRKMIKRGELPATLKYGAYMTTQQTLDKWLENEAMNRTQNDSQKG